MQKKFVMLHAFAGFHGSSEITTADRYIKWAKQERCVSTHFVFHVTIAELAMS